MLQSIEKVGLVVKLFNTNRFIISRIFLAELKALFVQKLQ